MSDDIENVVVKDGRGDVGGVAGEAPDDVVGASDISFRAGEADTEHGSLIVAVPATRIPCV